MNLNCIYPNISIEDFSKVVEAIYDCALDPSRWNDTVFVMAELFHCQYGALGVVDVENVRNELTFHVGVNDQFARTYAEVYGAMNPHNAPLQFVPVGEVVTTPMLVDWQEFLESRFYEEFWKPAGLYQSIGLNVLKTGKRAGALAFTRTKSQGPFEDDDLRLLSLLAPHVCRSVTVSDALNLKTVKSNALEATLDALACGVYLTDGQGRIAYMNCAAEHQAKTSNAVRIANNRMMPIDPAARAALTKAIAKATDDETELSSGGMTLALPGENDTGLVATILPLNRGQRRDLCGGFAATVAIFVQDPIVVPPLPGEAFAKLYGLTGSELRVLLAMSPGLSVKEAAKMLGISEATTKTHLSHIYAKTNTSKQTELLQLFMGSAPPVQAAPTHHTPTNPDVSEN